MFNYSFFFSITHVLGLEDQFSTKEDCFTSTCRCILGLLSLLVPIFVGMGYLWVAIISTYVLFGSHWYICTCCLCVAELSNMHFNVVVSRTKVFVSCIKHVHFQCQKCSCPAQSAFVCSVILYPELSSRDCHIASDKRIHLLFGSWLRKPPFKKE